MTNYNKRVTDEHLSKLEEILYQLKQQVSEIDKKLFIGNGKPSVLTTLEIQNIEICNLKQSFGKHLDNSEKTKDSFLKPLISHAINIVLTLTISVIAVLKLAK